MNKKVAVTGDGLNDVESLQGADVGLAMGSSVSVAKEAASIILTDSDFEAAVRSVMWGRNIYHNVTRFIQFQMTVNVSAILTIFIGIILFKEQPLNSVQLLWINLIMDTAAALALASEPPLPQVIQGPSFKKEASIMTKTVWRQVLGISLWNVVVMVFLMFFGRMIGGLASYETSQDSEAKDHHLTYVFNTFVIMQLFNMINCRKIGKRDFNVFESLFHNWYFVLILAFCFGAQYMLVNCFNGIVSTVPLNRSEWGACITVGATPLLISAILKLTPESWVERINTDKFVNEKEKAEDPIEKIKNRKQKA